MIRKLLAFGAASVAAVATALPAAAWIGGLGCGLGCGCGPCGLGISLAGWWGPLVGWPWGMFTPLGCGCW